MVAARGRASGVAVMAWLLVAQGPLRYVENWFGDLRVALVTPRQPASDEVVVLTINDDTLSTFPYRSPVRTFLADLVTQLVSEGAKAIGLGFLFDQPDRSRRRSGAYSRTPRDSAVPRSSPTPISEHDPGQTAVSGRLHPGFASGFADCRSTMGTGLIRTLFPGRMAADGRPIPGMAAALAGGALPQGLSLALSRARPGCGGGYVASAFNITRRIWPGPCRRPGRGQIVLVGAGICGPAARMSGKHLRHPAGQQDGSCRGHIHAHGLAQSPGGTLVAAGARLVVMGSTGLPPCWARSWRAWTGQPG